MAYYYSVYLWYRGCLIKTMLRYDCYMNGFQIVKGKPFAVTSRDHRRIARLIYRKPSIAMQMDQFHEAYARL